MPRYKTRVIEIYEQEIEADSVEDAEEKLEILQSVDELNFYDSRYEVEEI